MEAPMILSKNKDTGEDFEDRLHHQSMRYAAWTIAWTVSTAVVVFGGEFLWKSSTGLKLLSIGINLGIGVLIVRSFRRLLRRMDELQRRIQLEAMAMALGAAVFGGMAYSMLDITNVISSDAEIGIVVALVGLVYGLGIFLGNRRYR